jgi:hypothetical protein
MRTAKANGSTEIDRFFERDIARNVNTTFRQVENGNDETSSSELGTLLHRVAEASTHEVEIVIDELYGLRDTLVSDGVRIQNDVARYAELNHGAMQLATIISDGVKKMSGAPSK